MHRRVPAKYLIGCTLTKGAGINYGEVGRSYEMEGGGK